MKKIIDFHHHVTPPEYVKLMNKHGIEGNTGVKFKKFDPAKTIKIMNRTKIDKAFLSISTPGVYVKDDRTSAHVARICNNYIKVTTEKYPERFGGFGALPFPARKESLQELEYIFDSLKLDGVSFLTNVKGTYFGEPGYDELFQELNKRAALVFLHPEDILIHKGIYISITGVLERMIDTTRSAYNLLLNGYLDKYPKIRFILSHGGGGIPVLADRIVLEYFRRNNKKYDESLFKEKLSLLQNYYFDTAQRGPEILNSLKDFCGSSHIVFGSDLPYTPPFEIVMSHKEINTFRGFSTPEKENFYNGSLLNPQLRGA